MLSSFAEASSTSILYGKIVQGYFFLNVIFMLILPVERLFAIRCNYPPSIASLIVLRRKQPIRNGLRIGCECTGAGQFQTSKMETLHGPAPTLTSLNFGIALSN